MKHAGLVTRALLNKTPLSRSPPLELSSTAFAKLASDLPLARDAKQAMSQDYATTADRDRALLIVARSINDFFAKQTTTLTSEDAYTVNALELYDQLVWQFNAPFLWRINVEEVQELYNECTAQNHCEVAVGTGIFLTGIPHLEHVTLLDLNPNTLQVCEQRLKRDNLVIDKVVCDILKDVPDDRAFHSVAANFLIHCLHGGDDTTRVACRNIAKLMTPEGVFFGSTILGKDLEADAESAGPAALETNGHYNKVDIFGNQQDCFIGISKVLQEVFEDVEVWQVGYCAMWKVRTPR
jgi:hypothetical protein